MGRDTSLIVSHPDFTGEKIRGIISSDDEVKIDDGKVRFSLKPNKVFIFDGSSAHFDMKSSLVDWVANRLVLSEKSLRHCDTSCDTSLMYTFRWN